MLLKGGEDLIVGSRGARREGSGPISASLPRGRDFGAWLELVPRQMSTGDRTILGKIPKRRNRYLRVLFVQAAWVVLVEPQSWERYGLGPWIVAAKKRLHHNVWRSRLQTSCPASPGRSWPGAGL